MGLSWIVIGPFEVVMVAVWKWPGSMQVGGADANEVVRGEDPSSAGHGVAPVRVAPVGAAGGVIPDDGIVVDAGVVLDVEDLVVEERDPMNAPSVESTTTTATAPAANCRRRLAFCCRAADAALAR